MCEVGEDGAAAFAPVVEVVGVEEVGAVAAGPAALAVLAAFQGAELGGPGGPVHHRVAGLFAGFGVEDGFEAAVAQDSL
jgi:hypothetical protein